MVRMFAGLLQGQDARTEVPPRGLFAGKLRRGRPYIYSEAEVARIVARASTLPSRYGMAGWWCSTLFGLIAVTGLRINEAIALDDDESQRRRRHGETRQERDACAEHGCEAARLSRRAHTVARADARSVLPDGKRSVPQTAVLATTSRWSARRSVPESDNASASMSAGPASRDQAAPTLTERLGAAGLHATARRCTRPPAFHRESQFT